MKILPTFLVFFSLIALASPIHTPPLGYQWLNSPLKLDNNAPITLLNQYQDSAWEILSLQNTQKEWVSTLLTLPYIAYSPQGLIANYDNNTNDIMLFSNNKIFPPLEQRALFPKVVFPFLIMLSSDRTYLEVYLVKNNMTRELITQINTENIVTSASASPNGRFLAISTLSNELLILDLENEHPDMISINLNFPHPTMYAVDIKNNGFYYVLGSYKPSMLGYGSIMTPDIVTKISLDLKVTAQTQDFLSTNNFFFVHGNYHLAMFTIHPNQVKQEPLPLLRAYNLVRTVQTSSEDVALLYEMQDNQYLLDIINTKKQKLLHKTQFYTTSIPKFYQKQEKYYLTYKEGILIL